MLPIKLAAAVVQMLFGLGGVIVCGDVSLFGSVGIIPAPRCSRGAAFGGDDGLIREFFADGVIVPPIVMQTDNVKLIEYHSHVGYIDRRHNGTGGVESASARRHSGIYLFALLGGVVKLLVAHRPEEDRRAVSVS